jgi:hypothetical protein
MVEECENMMTRNAQIDSHHTVANNVAGLQNEHEVNDVAVAVS